MLPRPKRARWQLLRSGLVNLFHYADEQFWYEDGRLLLRGNNGTGKSRVLALQLPFLLDAELNPTRMEPDRSPSKRPEWNLLLGGKHRDRLGYTWLELGRVDDDGNEQYFTLGCGLHAVKDRGRTDAWFFTTDRRIDVDWNLVRDRVPHNRARLAEALGDAGVIYKTRGEYCRAVDDHLFRLRDRYRALVDLLIQLRVPQLSRDFDEKRISAQLSDALPPLAPEILDQVAGAMRDLDEQRARLEETRRSAAAVESFERHYAAYLQIALKRRVSHFFVQHNKYDRTQRKINEDVRLLEEVTERFGKAESRIAENKSAAAATDARLRVLRQSPEMKDARRLDDFRQRRDQTDNQAKASAKRLAEDEQSLSQLKKSLRESAMQLKFDRRRADTTLGDMLAREMPYAISRSLQGCRTSADDALANSKQLDEVGKAIERTAAGGDRLRDQHRRIEEAQRELQRAIDTQGQCERHADAARTRVGQSLGEVRQQRKQVCEAWLVWHHDANPWLPSLLARETFKERIAVTSESAFEDSEAAFDDTLFDSPSAEIHDIIQSALDTATESALTKRASLIGRIEACNAELAEATQRLVELESGAHLPPGPMPTRGEHARADRPGAPLYQLVDFAPSVPAEERAAWEAAIEASGLLDAWILPRDQNGSGDPWPAMFADEAIGDAFAMSTPEQPATNLSEVLVVADELPSGITADHIETLLRTIGCGRGQSETWFDRDGSWQVGARMGVWRKEVAEHIGITAREQRRLQAMERVRAEIAARQAEYLALETEQTEIAKTLSELRRLSSSRPSEAPFVQAVQKNQLAVEQEILAAQAVKEQIAVVGSAKDHVAAVSEKLRSLAEDLGLSAWSARLDDLNRLLSDLRSDLRSLRQQIEVVRRQIETVRQNHTAADQAEERWQRQRSANEAHQAEAVAASAAFETLRESVGKDVKRILEEIAAGESEQQILKQHEDALQKGLLAANGEKSALEARLEAARETLESHDHDRRIHIASLQTFVENDWISQTFDRAGVEAEPTADRSPTPWSPTRAVGIAKDWRSRLADVRDRDEVWENAQNELNVQFKTLEQTLVPAGLPPQMRSLDSLQTIQISYQGVEQSPRALSGLMNDEVRSRDALITQAERELFEKRLIGDIAQSLHKNIQTAHKLCGSMNEQVESRPMSTGMRLRFRWHPKPDESDQLRSACKALFKQPAAMSDDEQASLGEFLQNRIAEARQRDDAGTWQQHLAEALDYRTWFAFDIQREADGAWERLTKRTHGTGSGGERAVSLIMPMLAALAAYYSSADPIAPRIILMDEAYVGIDNEMRAKFMDLLVQFDLDFIMTSEREWGCYATMPSLAIYHLATRAGVDAILPTRWVWNGKHKHISDVHSAARQPSLIADDFD